MNLFLVALLMIVVLDFNWGSPHPLGSGHAVPDLQEGRGHAVHVVRALPRQVLHRVRQLDHLQRTRARTGLPISPALWFAGAMLPQSIAVTELRSPLKRPH